MGVKFHPLPTLFPKSVPLSFSFSSPPSPSIFLSFAPPSPLSLRFLILLPTLLASFPLPLMPPSPSILLVRRRSLENSLSDWKRRGTNEILDSNCDVSRVASIADSEMRNREKQ